MSDIIKITNLSSTYVEKLRNNNTFFKNEFLLCGVFYVNLYTYDIYKTLLNFTLPSIDVDNIKKISLNIFLNNIRVYNNMQANFKVSTLNAPFMSYTATWNNRPEISPSNSANFPINPSDLGKYIELDITSLVKNAYHNFYGIALESSQEKYTSMLQFLSRNSANPPYITIETVASTVSSAQTSTFEPIKNSPIQPVTNLPPETAMQNNIDISLITTLKNSIEELATKYSALESLVKATADSIPAEATINPPTEISNKLLSFEENLATFTDTINTLKLNDDIIKNNLNKTDETIASIVNHLAEIEVKENNALNEVKELSERVNNNLVDINTTSASNAASLEGINSKINSLQLSSASADLQSLRTDLESAINNIKTLESTLSLVNNEILELKTQYNAIKSQLNVISIDTLN